MTKTIEIRKIEGLAGYPRNGNFATQSKSYRWQVVVDGRVTATYGKLREAKEAARDYE
jgi:hypothetical protein